MSNTIYIPLGNEPLMIQGGISIVGTTIQEKTVGTNKWNTESYFTNLPVQIAGFNRMLPCDYSDCRDSSCFPPLPVFGVGLSKIATYENDITPYRIQWSGYKPVFQIQKQNQQWFGAKSNLLGWTTVATITNNTHGNYYPVGSIPNNPTWAEFDANWGLIISVFGPGIYRIVVSSPFITGDTQASVSVVISSSGFPQNITGIFTIGVINFVVNYTGSYTGYLTYLAALINAQGTYTASTLSNGLKISGTNYNLSNGIIVSQTLSTSTGTFNAQTGISKQGFNGVNETKTGTGTQTIDNKPQLFNVVNFNNGNDFDVTTGTYTCPSILNGALFTFAGTLTEQAINNTGGGCGMGFSISIYQNGVFKNRYQLAYAGIPSVQVTASYSFNLTLNTGDTVYMEFAINGEDNLAADSVTLNLLSGTFYNIVNKSTTTNLGTLSGGVAPSTSYECALASQPVLARLWNCVLAKGTVKFESTISGTVGDAYNDGSLFIFNGYQAYDSIRLPGFFGNMEPIMEEVVNEFGYSTSEKLGYMEKVRGKLTPNNKFFSKTLPFWAYRGLLQYGFLPGNVLISDYNSNNANYFYQINGGYGSLQKMKGTAKTTYYNKGRFDKSENFANRLLKFEITCEDAIQSGIATTC